MNSLLKTIIQFCFILGEVIFVSTGRVVSQAPLDPAQTIKIGLLIQDSSRISAVQGAELAVQIANKTGGMNSHPFQLVVRSMEGPWGTGSKQAVNLIFEEKVWALLGSHDGRNAHLVEQAATKSAVVFVSAWSGDPTLSQAFVPWFFNCIPNDLQQSEALIEEIYNKRKFSKPTVIHGNDYDSKMTLNNFLKSVKMSGKSGPVQICYDDYDKKTDDLFDEIIKEDADCIVIFCRPSASLALVQQIRQEEIRKPVFGSISILNENELSVTELQQFDNILSVPSGERPDSENVTFRQKYQRIYGKPPGMVASYSYDGMKILIEAIRKAGIPDREKIQKALQEIHYDGVTGLIRFDDKGNRRGNFEVTNIKKGVPFAIE